MLLTIDNFDFKGKTVALRVDINSPIDPQNEIILDDARIRACSDTITELSNNGAKVVIMAHQSRPGKKDYTTLKSHAEILSKVLNKEVKYVDDMFGSHAESTIINMEDGDIVLLENVRFYAEEVLKDWKKWKDDTPKKQGKTLMIRKIHHLFDYFINDAFAAAHRAQPSLVGLAYYVPAIAGNVMYNEIKTLSKVLNNPEKPCVFVLGGAKADDSIEVIKNVLSGNIADKILISGIVANIFLLAKGYDIGDNKAVVESMGYLNQIEIAEQLIATYGDKIVFPIDVALNIDGERKEVDLNLNEKIEYPIYDMGSKTIELYNGHIKNAKTVVANGPAGVFENKNFIKGTEGILNSMAETDAFTIIGGGHLSAAAAVVGLDKKMDHISTGGGACIEFLAGKTLPVIKVLENSYNKYRQYGRNI
ncbi:Phosphoglycerate kinase [Methanococcus aeolicus Nankai-3]|uniref:Phosphoglycerate kinase n=1 Tax=Methanococcus aeolicus (strain ATCC BAA-1280 / DSM 17508 / OCM 812 / Nankai-3) TaxID=419665 RepID=A6UUA9_META3|nr:phosphoglycerate kinase [Methanococcus aeolicus]ABR56081.1 Phosphoglycerate kinase [Methanococcus aeolicus Nankai-3]